MSRAQLNLSEFLLGCTKKVLFPDGEERDVEFQSPGVPVEKPEFGIPSVDGSRFIIQPELRIPDHISPELQDVLRRTEFN